MASDQANEGRFVDHLRGYARTKSVLDIDEADLNGITPEHMRRFEEMFGEDDLPRTILTSTPVKDSPLFPPKLNS